MNSFLKNIKNIEILLIILIYLVFFSIALLSFKDFGISVDEWELRVHGFVNLKYIWLVPKTSVQELDHLTQQRFRTDHTSERHIAI